MIPLGLLLENVQEYRPSRGQDKIARLNSVSDIIASGKVWVPKTRWAEELVDEIIKIMVTNNAVIQHIAEHLADFVGQITEEA